MNGSSLTSVPRLWDLDFSKLPGPLRKLGAKELHLWVGAWLLDRARKAAIARRLARATGPRHLLFALCDHYEPLHGGVSRETGIARVDAWSEGYPHVTRGFRDANGRAPRHSFFFPGEQYDPRFVEPLAKLTALGLGEVEVHLHHDGDTKDTLRASLQQTLQDLDRHGLVPRGSNDRGTRARATPGNPSGMRWAFIHGNWCLANARRDRRWCGVDDEIPLLYDLGCYADLTFPSAPDESQPGVVNSIYYPAGDPARRRAYEHAERAKVGTSQKERLLIIEGPLALALRPAGDARGRGLRIESAAIDHTDPPTGSRLATWVDQAVGIEGRPEWVFVKVHTHGAPERNARVLLGEDGLRFHQALARYNDGQRWKLHYVTAREMFNVARAAMDGKAGDPSSYFDYDVPPPPCAD